MLRNVKQGPYELRKEISILDPHLQNKEGVKACTPGSRNHGKNLNTKLYILFACIQFVIELNKTFTCIVSEAKCAY